MDDVTEIVKGMLQAGTATSAFIACMFILKRWWDSLYSNAVADNVALRLALVEVEKRADEMQTKLNQCEANHDAARIALADFQIQSTRALLEHQTKAAAAEADLRYQLAELRIKLASLGRETS